jgi:hypothetical protein
MGSGQITGLSARERDAIAVVIGAAIGKATGGKGCPAGRPDSF